MRGDYNHNTPSSTAYIVSVTKLMTVESLLKSVIKTEK